MASRFRLAVAGAAMSAGLLSATGPATANVDASPAPRGRPADLAIVTVSPEAFEPPLEDDGAVPVIVDEITPEPSRPRVPTAAMKGLDKFSGRADAFDAPIGVAVDYERLVVSVATCQDARGEGVAAFVTVQDRKAPGAIVFEGWMFSASPALSALDHPRYDVWVLSCSTVSGDAS